MYPRWKGIFGMQTALTCCLLHIPGIPVRKFPAVHRQLRLIMIRWKFCYSWRHAIWLPEKSCSTEAVSCRNNDPRIQMVGRFYLLTGLIIENQNNCTS